MKIINVNDYCELIILPDNSRYLLEFDGLCFGLYKFIENDDQLIIMHGNYEECIDYLYSMYNDSEED